MTRIPLPFDLSGTVLDPSRSLQDRQRAATNLFDFLVRGNIADKRRMPAEVIGDGPQRTLYRYETAATGVHGPPVLLVPPLGAPATCMDLRRGCSLAEHLVQAGRRAYLVDYGPVGFGDKDLGLEHWITEVVPEAVRQVSADAGDQPVQLVGWCMGGLFSIVSVAAFPELPVGAVAMVASPFDTTKMAMADPLRQIGRLTGGTIVGTAIRAMGGAPSRVVGAGFKATALTTYLKKPLTLFSHRDDREFLAHIEAVDEIMDNMYAYPGRAMGQAYHRLFRANELASGRIQGPTRVVELADVRVPVMNVAGATDVIAPAGAVHHVGELLPNSPDVRLPTAPGGHLGVLTGRSAATTTWAYLDEFLAAAAEAVPA